jgi:uncharacterized protein (TIGR01244 family)
MPIKLLACLLSLALAGPCLAQPAAAPLSDGKRPALAARPAQWARPIDASRNLYQIAPDFYRSAQPEQSDAARLHALGIRTIISLRARHRDEDVLDLPGVKLIRIPINTWDIDDAQVAAALRAIQQARQDGPVLLHCHHGSDRTGTVAALYRILEQGWTREQALRELQEGGYGFHEMWINIPRYIRRVNLDDLRARLAQGGPQARPVEP